MNESGTNQIGSSRLGVAQFARLAYRKAIYRRADFIECGASVRDHREPQTPFDLTFEVVEPDGYDAVLEVSPHLAQDDIDYLRTVDARLVLVRDGEHVAGMNWFVPGPCDLWISELRQEVPLTAGEHYSCRTYVDPNYRGRALADHMIFGYAGRLDDGDRIWGIVMTRNGPSLRFLARIGWQATGRWTARVRFGRFSTRHEVHAPQAMPS